MPLDQVTIHHEGAGAPTKDPSRYAPGGYAYGVGLGAWVRIRSPYVNWATLGFNHRDVTICLSGNRHQYSLWQRILGVMKLSPVPAYLVTNDDLRCIAACCADARARGELVDHPTVVFHHDSPGSTTVCPGSNTYARQAEVIAACQAGWAPVLHPKPVLPKEVEMFVAHGPGAVYLVGGAKPLKVASGPDEVALIAKLGPAVPTTKEQLAVYEAAAK